MPDTSEFATETLHIRDEFPPNSTAEWDTAIRADLKGADYDKKLIWRTQEGITVKPFYRAEDIAGLEPQTHLIPGVFPYVRGSGTQVWRMDEPGTPLPENAIRGDLVAERGGTVVQELGYALAEGVERIATLTESGKSVDEAAKSIYFVFSVGSNFFFEIAKFRAARLVWARAVAAFQPEAESSCLMRIHARTALSNKSIYDPYTNLLRATTEALSATIGGVDSLEVEPLRFPERLATNVQRILMEESHVDRVADPAAGSWYIEAITDILAREAWKLFQQVEAAGGFNKTKESIQAAIAQSRTAKEKALASRRKVLVGVNNYPDVNETIDEDQLPAAPPDIWREADVFERIRLRSDRHAKQTGKRPKVLLLESGDLKMRQARAQFCQNLFGCGGFAIEHGDKLDGSDSDLVILCSSDPEYTALAREICPQAKQPVLVAGNPKEQIEALNAAGVAGYLHILSNAVETLTEWQDRLGIARES